jgi:hypothetical protein
MNLEKSKVLELLLARYTIYNSLQGKLFWAISPSYRAPVGSEVGALESGYLRSQITKNGVRYRFSLHKAVWFWEKGYYPKGFLDHKDLNRLNNKIENLRLASRTENNRNRFYGKGSSKYQGVSFHNKNKKWIAQITQNYKNIYLGSFDSEEEAALVYNRKAKEFFRDFAYLNTLEHFDE